MTDHVEPSPALRGHRGLRWAGIVLAVIGVVSSPVWGRRVLMAMSFFRIRSVEVDGARYTDPADIVRRLHVDTMASLWDHLQPYEARLRGLPQVQSVAVERKLPGTLVVALTERVPVALVPQGGAGALRAYDAAGMAFAVDPTRGDLDVPILQHADLAALRLLGDLRVREPAFYARVSEMRRTPAGAGGGDFSFTLPTFVVRTETDVDPARFAEVALVAADLGRRHIAAQELDLRFRDQVVVRRAAGTEPARTGHS